MLQEIYDITDLIKISFNKVWRFLNSKFVPLGKVFTNPVTYMLQVFL